MCSKQADAIILFPPFSCEICLQLQLLLLFLLHHKTSARIFLDLSEPVVIEVAMIVVVVDSYDNSKNYRIDCDYYLWWLLKT